jgi:hypothetical protein
MVCIAMEVMDTISTELLFNLIKSQGNDRYTILLNQADDIWDDGDTENDRKLNLEKIKKVVCYRREFRSEKEKERVILTCLKDIKNLDALDGIQRTCILMDIELQQTIYKIILEKIPKENEYFRTIFISKMVSSEMPKQNKKIKIKKGKGVSPLLVIVSKNKDLYEEKADDDEYMIIDSFNELVKELTCVNTPHPIIRLRWNQDIIMNSIDDFLSVVGHVFIVTSL